MTTSWSFALDVDAAPAGPVFLRIARALSEEIRRGRLAAGDELPGSRTLATSLGVHRNTVLAAYRELLAEGWIESAPARGMFVSSRLPDVAPRRFSARAPKPSGVAAKPGFDMPAGPAPWHEVGRVPELSGKGPPMTLGGGVPDVRLVPSVELSRAIRRVLRRKADAVLSYGPPEGPAELRRALAEMLSATRGIKASAGDVLVTRGSQMGIDLAARALLEPGDVVAVEALGYRPAWAALRAAGATLVPIPVDDGGLDVDALAKVPRLRAVYVTPHHQFPTTVTLAPERRLRLLELAERRRAFLLEDDYDHEFHYDGRPVLPLASADVPGVVVYVGTLSKVLAPGMRIGFVVAPAPALARLAGLRRVVDRQGDQLLEHAVADLLDEGAIQRHIRRARRLYQARRDTLASLLAKDLAGVLSFSRPNGGTAIWARVAAGVSVDAWAQSAAEHGLVLQAARQFAFDGKSRPFVRLGFAQHEAREAREAVRRLVAALPKG